MIIPYDNAYVLCLRSCVETQRNVMKEPRAAHAVDFVRGFGRISGCDPQLPERVAGQSRGRGVGACKEAARGGGDAQGARFGQRRVLSRRLLLRRVPRPPTKRFAGERDRATCDVSKAAVFQCR